MVFQQLLELLSLTQTMNLLIIFQLELTQYNKSSIATAILKKIMMISTIIGKTTTCIKETWLIILPLKTKMMLKHKETLKLVDYLI